MKNLLLFLYTTNRMYVAVTEVTYAQYFRDACYDQHHLMLLLRIILVLINNNDYKYVADINKLFVCTLDMLLVYMLLV